MTDYRIGERTLTQEEELRHRSAYNAALSRGETVEVAFDLADETVLTFRQRLLDQNPPPLPKRLKLVDQETVVAKWALMGRNLTASENNLIKTMREQTCALYPAEIMKMSNVRHEVVRTLFRAGILVDADGEA